MANIFAIKCLRICMTNINPSITVLLFYEDNSIDATIDFFLNDHQNTVHQVLSLAKHTVL